MDPNTPLDEIIKNAWDDYKNSQLSADSVTDDPSYLIFAKGFFYAYNYLNAGNKKEKPHDTHSDKQQDDPQWSQYY